MKECTENCYRPPPLVALILVSYQKVYANNMNKVIIIFKLKAVFAGQVSYYCSHLEIDIIVTCKPPQGWVCERI